MNTTDSNEQQETTRVKERLNLHYHGMKEREKPVMFREVREWLREMDDAETQSLHSLICGVVHRHCAGTQLPRGTNGLENDLIDALADRSRPLSAAPADELVDEVQRRMDQVVEAAVEWHQAGREGGEWFEAAEKLSAAINSLLELRSKPTTTSECFCGTELEAGLCPNGHDPVTAATTSSPAAQPRKLTLPEINHLLGLLRTERESGSYVGPREQYYARTERLIKWCDEQIGDK